MGDEDFTTGRRTEESIPLLVAALTKNTGFWRELAASILLALHLSHTPRAGAWPNTGICLPSLCAPRMPPSPLVPQDFQLLDPQFGRLRSFT
jgi:hypothetical protein